MSHGKSAVTVTSKTNIDYICASGGLSDTDAKHGTMVSPYKQTASG